MKKYYILLSLGLFLIIFTYLSRIYTQSNNLSTLDSLETSIIHSKEFKENKSLSSLALINKEPQQLSKDYLGIIKIQKLNLKLPLIESATIENLKKGVCHITSSKSIGSNGNCVIAGHRSYSLAKYFDDLDELAINDIVEIETFENNYSYKVFDKKVIEETELNYDSNFDNNQSYLTLMTCHPKIYLNKRLLIICKKN